MKALRQFIFWAHVIVAVPAAIVILIMSVTGVLLTYEKQMSAASIKSSYKVELGSPRLPLDDITAVARRLEGRSPSTMTVYSDPERPVEARFGRQRTLFLDPYTGKALGDGSTSARRFFRTMTDWHRWLGQSGAGRDTGKAITGACNLAFLFLVVSGIYLWWPRKWTRAAIRNVAWFRRGLSGKARNFNWHNTIGFWMFLPLLVIVASGTVISYPWASDLVYKVAGEMPPATRREEGGQRQSGPSPSLGPILAQAQLGAKGWQSIAISLPTNPESPVSVAIDKGTGGQPQLRKTLKFDAVSGEMMGSEDFASVTPGRKARSILRFVHTGEIGGIAGQALAGLASLGAAVLVWTGLALAIRRFRSWLGRRSRAVAVEDQESSSKAA